MEQEKPSKQTLSEVLLNSSAIGSLKLETNVYDAFKKMNWNVQHSPYYIDSKTGKLREIDITARRLYNSSTIKNLSCDIVFLVECKSIKDYHIIATNKCQDEEYVGRSLVEIQLGHDYYSAYSRLGSLLDKHGLSGPEIKRILREIENTCHPEKINFFNDYRVGSFALPVFNSFRETNIGTTKDLENSVVWKSFQSLRSCIEKYQEIQWEDIDFYLSNITFEELDNKIGEITDYLKLRSQHVKLVHPVLVLESNLWELNGDSINNLNSFRLIFQKIYEDEMWIDIVNKDYLNEYLEKAKFYDDFMIRKKFTF